VFSLLFKLERPSRDLSHPKLRLLSLCVRASTLEPDLLTLDFDLFLTQLQFGLLVLLVAGECSSFIFNNDGCGGTTVDLRFVLTGDAIDRGLLEERTAFAPSTASGRLVRSGTRSTDAERSGSSSTPSEIVLTSSSSIRDGYDRDAWRVARLGSVKRGSWFVRSGWML
jgi:hypothetical protein